MLTLQKSFSALFITSLLFTGSVASFKEVHAQTPVVPTAISITNIPIQDELYFGRNRLKREVSEEEFQKFLQTVITPRFPDGLTVLNANGQFRGSSEEIIREKTKLVILIHPNSYQKNRAVEEIIEKYKAQFQQESVLRVTSVPAQVSF